MNSAKEIRQTFFDFFKAKQHEIVASAPIVLKDDPTLMFTNAGMNQFKEVFLGITEAKQTKVADTQKCLRVSGKHNDLEEVGVDTYHHTMFEMLGNWSFGDSKTPSGGYFKEEAIDWAWELLTEVYKIDKDRLYVTVFEGDKQDGTTLDTESIGYWKKHIEDDRILACDKKDNFWEMGETGPCGPCSEIHVDLRVKEERRKIDGKTLVNKDHEQVIEIWNLVFIQYQRLKDKSLKELPAKHIDTGMGFERLVRAIHGKQSNYDTDIFMPLIRGVEGIAGMHYGKEEQKDIAFRVIADHLRAVAFTIADGQLPSNTGAGYVIRRILRRAIRYAYSYLNIKEPFMYSMLPLLASQFEGVFPELEKQMKLIEKVVQEEERQFFKTLEKGIVLFNDYLKNSMKESKVDGDFAFMLYDTFGFPIDLTSLMATENNASVDIKGFEKALKVQKERSKAAGKQEVSDWIQVSEDTETEFVGYDQLETTSTLIKYRKVEEKGSVKYHVVLNKTPFYARGGGQVGDKGILYNEKVKLEVIDTIKEHNLIIHVLKKSPESLGTMLKTQVNSSIRQLTKCNHSATHLLHEALREELGTHVEQRGSLVNDSYLRFDFSHFEKVSDEQLKNIEQKVNDKILNGINLIEHRSISIDNAKKMGAMALFGEKYGDKVRVIQFDSSVELCGGIHVQNTAEIGLFKFTSESSVAAGIRRVEAISSKKAIAYLNEAFEELKEVKSILKNPKNLIGTLDSLLVENTELKKQLESFEKEQALNLGGDLKEQSEKIGDLNFIVSKVNIPSSAVKDLVFELRGAPSTIVLLANQAEGKVTLSLGASDELVKEKGFHAGNIIRDLAKEIGGGGGGQPFFATAGGKNPQGIEAAFSKIKALKL